MQRRNFLAAGAALAAPAVLASRSPEAGVTDTELLVGQSAVLTGPLSPGALAGQGGAQLAFDAANANGGIAGRRIRLVSLDDGFDPARSHANYQALATGHHVLACFMGIGTQGTLAGLPVLREHNVPLVGAIAVADSARERTQGVAYYTRASQLRESEALVQHLRILGLQRVAVAHLATPGGREVLAQLEGVAQRLGLQLLPAVAVAPDGSDAAAAGKALAQLQPQASILFLSGPAATALIQSASAAHPGQSFYGMSILGGAVARALGEQSRGLAISQVTPYPWDAASPEANAFRAACDRAGVPIGYPSFEGYIGARTLVEALRQAGRDVSRAKLHAALRKLKVRVAGMDVDFSGGQVTGSRFIELVRVRPDGKFVR